MTRKVSTSPVLSRHAYGRSRCCPGEAACHACDTSNTTCHEECCAKDSSNEARVGRLWSAKFLDNFLDTEQRIDGLILQILVYCEDLDVSNTRHRDCMEHAQLSSLASRAHLRMLSLLWNPATARRIHCCPDRKRAQLLSACVQTTHIGMQFGVPIAKQFVADIVPAAQGVAGASNNATFLIASMN